MLLSARSPTITYNTGSRLEGAVEQAFLAWAKQRVAKLPKVELGIGDDAALLAPHDRSMVVTTDSLCDGTHFELANHSPRRVGRKLAAVNLSDLAAMGADPSAFFLSLCLPRQGAQSIATEIFEGVLELAQHYQVAIAGGDTNVWDGPLCLHLTAIGIAPPSGCWLRSGAQPGDSIVVSGTLGGSILGKHFDFQPRLELAKFLRDRFPIHAAMDISDGLAIDLGRMTTASGCGAEVILDQIPISDAAREHSQTTGLSPLSHALSDGEDFELLMAVPSGAVNDLLNADAGISLTKIGEFVSRTGTWSRSTAGARPQQLPPSGYLHR